MFQRTVTGKVKASDGSEQNVTHVSTNAYDLAVFITSYTDDQPGTEFTFTVKSEGTRFDEQG